MVGVKITKLHVCKLVAHLRALNTKITDSVASQYQNNVWQKLKCKQKYPRYLQTSRDCIISKESVRHVYYIDDSL